MGISIKLLLLKPHDGLGNGLAAVRERSSDLIDISDYEFGIGDPTISMNSGYLIKDNKVYRIFKSYFDIQTSSRIFIGFEDMEWYDILSDIDIPDPDEPTTDSPSIYEDYLLLPTSYYDVVNDILIINDPNVTIDNDILIL